MRSKIISILLCLAVAFASVWLLIKAPTEVKRPTDEPEHPLTEEVQGLDNADVSRAYVISTAHDAENLLDKLAYGGKNDYENEFSALATRFSKSADYLKNELQDYYGASYFTKVSEIFQDVSSTPFSSSADFSSRVSKILVELENAFPAEIAETLNENDPNTPMYYPKFDTDPNGKTTLALLAIYRQQYQKSTGSVLLTFGGNMRPGDTLLDADKENSFHTLQEKNKHNYPLYSLSSVLSTDASSFANLTVPLTEAFGDGEYHNAVKGLPSYAKLLENGGINVVSITDPDINSFGEKGKEDTKNALKSEELLYSDESTITYHQTSLGTIAYLSYDIVEDVKSNKNLTYSEIPKRDIETAKNAGAKLVVVHFNWQTNLKDSWNTCTSQVLTARAAVDNGANLVLGSHPGTMQAIEQYNGVSIVYSPGDLFTKGSGNENAFLFQQAFSLDENQNAVPGQIQVFPISGAGSEEGIPKLSLDSASASSFSEKIRSYSSAIRNGVGKKPSFGLEHLNLISIQK